MTKLRKQRRKKKFNYGVNKKRVKQKQEKNSKYNVKVGCTLSDSGLPQPVALFLNMPSPRSVLLLQDGLNPPGLKAKSLLHNNPSLLT